MRIPPGTLENPMTMLEFKQRARRSETPISNRRTWDSRDNRFAVVHMEPKLTGDVRPYYLAIERRPDAGERIISRHRTRNAAEVACTLADGEAQQAAAKRVAKDRAGMLANLAKG